MTDESQIHKNCIYSFIFLLISIIIILFIKFYPFSSNDEKKDEHQIKAIIGIDIGSTTSGFNMIVKPYENPTVDESDLVESQIIINKHSKDGLFIGSDAYNNFKGEQTIKIIYISSYLKEI